MKTLALFAFAALTSLSAVACGTIEKKADCIDVCTRYRDCFDNDYNVTDCRDRCENRGGTEQQSQDQADACSDCMDDKSCTAAVFTCGASCAGIIP